MPSSSARSIVFVQYAGNLADTYRRLARGEPETYYAQRYSIDVVCDLADADTRVCTVVCQSDAAEDTVLDNGVRVIAMKPTGGVDESAVWAAVASCEPTHLCLRTPMAGVLSRALRQPSVESVLLTLADSFNATGPVAWWRNRQFRRLANHPKVLAVSNHGINSSRALQKIGVRPDKIVPWDWPHDVSPHQQAPKAAPSGATWTLMFVGALSESKGLGDTLRAVAALRARNRPVRLRYAGKGDAGQFAALAEKLGIADHVEALGFVAHATVVGLMRDADLVVVPSRHDYPEGFPMTIYEALSSRTPIVASDHPMYARHLARTGAAVVYPAGDATALAAAVEQLMDDPARYRTLSEASAASWDALQLPLTWGALVQAWLRPGPEGARELARHSLAHGGYATP